MVTKDLFTLLDNVVLMVTIKVALPDTLNEAFRKGGEGCWLGLGY